ncbi:methyltransferase domain-containing protein [Aquibacillus koreensis]|uniref:Methyltransferase domain-containing protein n=1 Tax=Aquibacillus koreensis TaxID=279446 RepID=A0A9X3WKH9_9BACI|nr:class I SAM-dependent methyltransferase [Aquibacillus koreensis]MCT2535832.1 methyltransferase domain-containing protein [Aquibacillus koreensis]MDC3420288.1 methyltransferase domain-containing protein [Aquibacillus koreensis]
MLKRVLSYAHELLQSSIQPGETVIDGTCGNGKDTIVLSKLVGDSGQVLAFDVQEQAIENTKQRLAEEKISNVKLIHDSHENAETYLPEEVYGFVGGAIFNLGYLPGSDKSVITKPTSTIQAVDTIVKYLKSGGLIILVVYYGHEGGEAEKNALLDHLRSFEQKNYNVLQYGFINQKNSPPFILAIEKK